MGSYLPKQMPKKKTTDIDKKLCLIQHLYGEDDRTGNLYELLENSEDRAEYEAFSRVKAQLENPALRMRVTAPDEVVDRLFVSAARPKPRQFWIRSIRRPRRLVLAGGVCAAAACAFFLLFLPGQNSDPPAVEPSSAVEELQWDDTQERIEMQHALSVVRQRTSPDLWDESAVMKLDSLEGVLDTSPPGVGTVSTTPQ